MYHLQAALVVLAKQLQTLFVHLSRSLLVPDALVKGSPALNTAAMHKEAIDKSLSAILTEGTHLINYLIAKGRPL